MANGAVQDLKSIIRGVGDIAGLDLANECKSGTLLPVANIANGILASQIATGSAKRQLLLAHISPAGAVAASDGATYFAYVLPGRAGIVKQITFFAAVKPAAGTNTLKVLKAAANGNTMLSTASVDPTAALTNATGLVATLTSTAADLAFTALQAIYCELVCGTQVTPAKDVKVLIEFEPTDF